MRLATYEEITFPTASPESSGQGKYQLNTGATASTPIAGSSKLRFMVQISETVSVAGDPSTKDINKTNLDLTGKYAWRDDTYVYLKIKGVVNWEDSDSDQTGSVAEVKGSLNFGRRWSGWFLYGHLVSGPTAPGMYYSKISFGVVREIGRFRLPIAAEE
jgi:hypothetical protein